MLLQGSDALIITRIAHSRGKLLVHTKPAALTDVISKGQISFSGAPNFHHAVLSKIVEPPSTKASADFAAPSYPYVGSPPTATRASAAAARAFSAQGATSTFGYSLTFTPTTATRLDISGTLCYLSFSVCGNGPSTGISAEVNLSGYIDAGDTSGGITLNGGAVTHTSISIKDWSSMRTSPTPSREETGPRRAATRRCSTSRSGSTIRSPAIPSTSRCRSDCWSSSECCPRTR